MDQLTPIILVSVLLMMVAIGIIVLVLVYQKKQLQYINEKEQLKASFEKEILESKLEIQEQTMKNISQEVHDNIGQVLSLVRLNIKSINCDEPKPVLQEKIQNISDLTGKVMQDLRNLARSLHSDIISERGLIGSVEYELEQLRKTGVYTTALLIEGEQYHLSDQKELILFRIFQEVMNNIVRHAGATSVEAVANFHPDLFVLTIKDNGKGFDAGSARLNGGLGIRNITNRSQIIGARCSINSVPGSGTEVTIELPGEQQ